MRSFRAQVGFSFTALAGIAGVLLAFGGGRSAEAGSSDVLVESYFVDPQDPAENTEVTFTLTIANTGDSSTGTFFVDLYSHLDDPPNPGDFGDDFCEMDPMGPTSTQQCVVSTIYSAPGAYHWWVQVDTEGDVFESNETNNLESNFITVQDDSDFDGVGDQVDNCLYWPNPGQTLPPYAVAGDSDCDGFSDARETYLTTDLTVHCASDIGPNNEPPPDFWPLDMNDDRRATTIDVGQYVGKLGKDNTEVGWTARLDLNQSPTGIINTVDVGLYVPRLGDTCSTSEP